MSKVWVVLLVVACGGGGAPKPNVPWSQPPSTRPAEPIPGPVAVAKPSFPGAPNTAAGDQLAWLFGVIAHHEGKLDRAEAEAHFHQSFLDQVPLERLITLFEHLGPQLAGLKIVDTRSAGGRLIAKVTAGDTKLRVVLELDQPSGKISGLVFQPDVEAGPKPTSFDEAAHMMSALAPRAQLLVASLDNGTCKPLHQLAPKAELAIGSAFKLYVLLGLVDRILAGKAKWDDEIAVRDDWKSLPSGITQLDPAGTKLTIKTLAERMISISDNTATDHLLYTVGRTAVEAAVRSSKHAQPSLDTPFLSTRELFLFKLATPATEIARYLALSPARRRAYVDKTLAGKSPTLDGADQWKTARQIDKLEWFASSEDLCRVMGTLWTRAQHAKAAPVLDVLAKNSGLPIDKTVFPYVGYKGGSEPGVLSMTYLLRRNDDRWFVVTMSFNSDEGGAVEEGKIIGVVSGIIELLGNQR